MSQHDTYNIYQPSGKFQVRFLKSNAWLLSRQMDHVGELCPGQLNGPFYPAFIFSKQWGSNMG